MPKKEESTPAKKLKVQVSIVSNIKSIVFFLSSSNNNKNIMVCYVIFELINR